MVAPRRKDRSPPKRLRDRHPVRARAVSLSVLLGMVPVLMPAPPRFCLFSTRTTRFSNRLATKAPNAPAGPPPITTKSYSFVSMLKRAESYGEWTRTKANKQTKSEPQMNADRRRLFSESGAKHGSMPSAAAWDEPEFERVECYQALPRETKR